MYTKIMGNKLCPKIILEGTRLTFKTEIAFELNEHPRVVGPRKYRYHSPLISAEWCTFTNYPWGRGPINFEPQEESLAMETYATWARMFELQKYYSWIVDRFHISTMAYQKHAYNKDYDFRWLEARLLPLNFRVVFWLPGLTLDISDNNVSAAVERVADWLDASGGLYMPDYGISN